MHSIRVDIVNNRLYLALEGFMTAEQMRISTDETIEAAKKLKPGYDIVTDISKFKVGDSGVAAEIERAQKFFVESGARRGVRIVGSSALTGIQFKRTAGEAHYASVNVATMEEAEKMLSQR
jgi:hypothetical protein